MNRLTFLDTFDQAGIPDAAGGDGCDIGAVEVQTARQVFAPETPEDLVLAVNTANAAPEVPAQIDLGGRTFTLSDIDNTGLGSNGLPVIDTRVTIAGSGGSIIERSPAYGTPEFRLFAVTDDGKKSERRRYDRALRQKPGVRGRVLGSRRPPESRRRERVQ